MGRHTVNYLTNVNFVKAGVVAVHEYDHENTLKLKNFAEPIAPTVRFAV